MYALIRFLLAVLLTGCAAHVVAQEEGYMLRAETPAAAIRLSQQLTHFGIVARPAFGHVTKLPFLCLERLDTERLDQIRRLPGVQYIEPILPHHLQESPTQLPPFIPNDVLVFRQWYLQQVRLPDLWERQRGSPTVVIAIIDAGADVQHPDLKNKWHYNPAERNGRPGIDDDGNGYVDDSLGYDFAQRTANVSDAYYHGTAVSGLAAAETNNGIGISGAGFQSLLLPLKVTQIDPVSGEINLVNLYEAMLYAADRGAKIINISGGRVGGFLQWEQDVIRHLVRERDVLIVAAAGNTQPTDPTAHYYPAAYADVIAVTSTDPADHRLDGYAHNPFITLAAPGQQMTTTYNRSFPPRVAYTTDDPTLQLNGTSFSTPLVAGTAALLRDAYPGLTAQQIGELLRVTADTIADLAPNQAYAERIGHGRLNALRAFVDYPLAKSIRLDSCQPSQPPLAGQSLTLIPTLTNHLRPTVAVQLELSSSSPYVEILQDQVQAGNFLTQESRSLDGGFLIRLDPAMPHDQDILFRLGIRDAEGYQDYQYFYLRGANPRFLHYAFNNLALTITDAGRLGFTDSGHTQGSGLVYAQQNHLKEASLMVRLPDGHFRDALQGNEGFVPGTLALQQPTPFRARTQAQFATQEGSLSITAALEGRRNQPHQDYLALRYTIQNTTAQTLDSLWLGLFLDWDWATVEEARWDNARAFAYSTNGTRYAGAKLLQGTDTYQGIAGWQIADGDRSRWLNEGIRAQLVRNQDVAQVIGQWLPALAAGASHEVVFILTFSNSPEGLDLLFREAQKAYLPPVQQARIPQVRTVLCPSADPSTRIRPTGGNMFRLYRPPQLTFAEQSGAELVIQKSDFGQLFYLTSTDAPLESDPLAVVFSEKQIQTNFLSPDTFDISQGQTVQFTERSPTPAVRWHWDFGDGTQSNARNPVHRYTRQGSFTIRLTITDAEGCQVWHERLIQIIRRGPVPILQNTYTACSSDSVLLRPQNGSRFRFYTRYPSDTLGEGREWLLTDPGQSQVWVTNLDSTRESQPTLVSISWNRLQARFSPSPEVDTVVAAQIQFRDESTFDYAIVAWEWDFGDGQTSTLPNPLHAYARQGVYAIRLRVTDVRGCTSVMRGEFRVGRRGPIPILPVEQVVCRDQEAVIRPGGGSRFRFYADAGLERLLSEGGTYAFVPTEASPAQIFVTNMDSVIESFPRALSLIQRVPRADFDFARELFLDENQEVRFTNLSSPSTAWRWDFGDGKTSTLRDPVHRYYAQGVYTVQLALTTADGCQATTQKKLTAFRRSPTPAIGTVFICQGDAATLTPQGGSTFRFFDSPTSGVPVFVGNSYTTPRLDAPRTYFITNIDSTLESVPRRVEVRFSKPVARLAQETDTLNLRFRQELLMVSMSTAARQWYWDLGNGTIARTPEVRASYTQTGVYPIQLIVRDSLACLDTTRSQLVVIDTLLLPPLPEGKGFQLDVFPNPSREVVNVHLQLPQAATLEMSLYDALGRRVRYWSGGPETDTYRLVFSLEGLPNGLYVLYLRTPTLHLPYKVIKE
ncbi:MAG: PKD domain-containing protein [Bernardetiaceae bacterium]